MKDFESKECQAYINKNAINSDFDTTIEFSDIQLAEIEVSDDLLLAVHRS
ncbi:hypothetical protein [Fluviispira vulneris]|nr:hypothetical protein [Fluviispira vulneris]